ncbi:phosphodiesterase [Brevundimonas aveniformis]|uniref:phosphodiesterase n=1 Tax=Brevundimonas aveniformis TaxID=370977 RepID=UPI002491FA97|nr:phosphodiesterase [Brevundimonas aveniformis]
MLIAQISDLHIGMGTKSVLNDERLEQVIERVQAAVPDLVLMTGDLIEGQDAAAYDRLKVLMAPLTGPVLYAIGNHDQREAFRAAFTDTPTHGGFVQYAREFDDRRIIVLDTVEAGQHGGAFCESRAAWLSQTLDERPDTPTMIALHHPPVASGIAWMDVGATGPWSERLEAVLVGRRQVVAMVAGHIHRPFVTGFAGHSLIVAPSSAPQVVLDLGSGTGDAGRTRLPRIVEEDPGFVLHLWNGRSLVSHFGSAKPHRIVASLDTRTGRFVAG